MICPSCDGILGGAAGQENCQGCGWTAKDPWPVHRLVVGSPHPMKDISLYPPRSGSIAVASDVPGSVIETLNPHPGTIAEPPAKKTRDKNVQ